MTGNTTSTNADAAGIDDDAQDAAVQEPVSSPPTDDPAAEPKALRRAAKAARTKATPLEAAASSAKAPGPTAGDDGAKRPRSSSTPNSARTRTKGSKTEIVLKKLRSAKGATITQLGEATGWQSHSVRGFLSAVVRKKLSLTLVSEIGKDGVRRYRIEDDGTTAR